MNSREHNEEQQNGVDNGQIDNSEQQTEQVDNYEVFLNNVTLSLPEDSTTKKENAPIFEKIYEFFNAPLTNDYKIEVFHSDEYFNPNSTVIQLNLLLFEHIIDSINNFIFSKGFEIHYTLNHLFRVERDENSNIKNLFEDNVKNTNEVIFHIEVRRLNHDELSLVKEEIEAIINDCIVISKDKTSIRKYLLEDIQMLEADRNVPFLKWLHKNNFVFSAVREYDYGDDDDTLKLNKEIDLGILKETDDGIIFDDIDMEQIPSKLKAFLSSTALVYIDKFNFVSRVYRSKPFMFFAIKYVEDGKLFKLRIYLGLLMDEPHKNRTSGLPLLFDKFMDVKNYLSIKDGSFKSIEYSRLLLNIPIDILFTLNSEDISKLLYVIYTSYHNQDMGYFFWKNSFDNSLQVVISVPEKNYSVETMAEVTEYLCDYFDTELIDADVDNSYAGYWLIYYYFISETAIKKIIDEKKITAKLNKMLKQWDELLTEHIKKYDLPIPLEKVLFYHKILPAEYTNTTPIKLIAIDIQNLEKAVDEDAVVLHFVTPEDNIYENQLTTRLRLYSKTKYKFSDLVPIFNNLGIRIEEESNIFFKLTDTHYYHLDTYRLTALNREEIDKSLCNNLLKECILAIFNNETENDFMNALVIRGRLNYKEIELFRVYFNYFVQLRVKYSKALIGKTLIKYGSVTNRIIKYFKNKFNPRSSADKNRELIDENETTILNILNKMSNSLEKEILYSFFLIVKSTLRTNYYKDEKNRRAISIKLDTSCHSFLQKSDNLIDIYIYSPHVEGIIVKRNKATCTSIKILNTNDNIRSIARKELLEKELQYFPLIFTPSVGYFVPKTKFEKRREVRTTKKDGFIDFVSSVLDITDNEIDGVITPPENVVLYDFADKYFLIDVEDELKKYLNDVNELSKSYNFWLSDVFSCSPNNIECDIPEKANMFYELIMPVLWEYGIDVEDPNIQSVLVSKPKSDFFLELLLSKKRTQVKACIDDKYIFIDPHIINNVFQAEVKRISQMENSSWNDYNREYLSPGGAIYNRNDDEIILTPEIKQFLSIENEKITPDELVQSILTSNVTMIYINEENIRFISSVEQEKIGKQRDDEKLFINVTNLKARILLDSTRNSITDKAFEEYKNLDGNVISCNKNNIINIVTADKVLTTHILFKQIAIESELDFQMMKDKLTSIRKDLHFVSFEKYKALQTSIILDYMNNKRKSGLYDSFSKTIFSQKNFEDIVKAKLRQTKDLHNTVVTKYCIENLYRFEGQNIFNSLKKIDFSENIKENFFLQQYFTEDIIKEYGDFINSFAFKDVIIDKYITEYLINNYGISYIYEINKSTGLSYSKIISELIFLESVFSIYIAKKSLYRMQYKMSPEDYYISLQRINSHIKFVLLTSLIYKIYPENDPAFSDAIKSKIKEFKEKHKSEFSFLTINSSRYSDFQFKRIISRVITFEIGDLILELDYYPAIVASVITEQPLKKCCSIYQELIFIFEINNLIEYLYFARNNSHLESIAISSLIVNLLHSIYSIFYLIVTSKDINLEDFIEKGKKIFDLYKDILKEFFTEENFSVNHTIILTDLLKQFVNNVSEE